MIARIPFRNKKKNHPDLQKEKLSLLIIQDLMSLPAYRLEKSYRKIFEDYEYRKIDKETTKNDLAIDPVHQEYFRSYKLISQLYKKPSLLHKICFYFASLPKTDKQLGYITIVLLIFAFIVKILANTDNPWSLLSLVLLVLFFELFFVVFSLRFILWQMNVDITFSAINRNLDNVYSYVQDLGIFDEKRIKEKADMISINLIEEEISDLDYRLRKINLFNVFFASFVVVIFLSMAGDSYVEGIKVLAKILGYDKLEVFKNLTTDRFAIFVLFPVGFALSKDTVVSALQQRNRKLRRSLAILRDQQNSA